VIRLSKIVLITALLETSRLSADTSLDQSESLAKKFLPQGLAYQESELRATMGGALDDSKKLSDSLATFTHVWASGHGGSMNVYDISHTSGQPKVIRFRLNEYYQLGDASLLRLPLARDDGFRVQISELPLTQKQYLGILSSIFRIGSSKIYQYKNVTPEQNCPVRPFKSSHHNNSLCPKSGSGFGQSFTSNSIMMSSNLWFPGDTGVNVSYSGYESEKPEKFLPTAIASFVAELFKNSNFQTVNETAAYHRMAFMNAYLTQRAHFRKSDYSFANKRIKKLATQFLIDCEEIRADLIEVFSSQKIDKEDLAIAVASAMSITKKDLTRDKSGTIRLDADMARDYKHLIENIAKTNK